MDHVASQDLNHVMSSGALMAGSTNSQEITLTINNSSLTQALAQVQAQASAAGSSTGAGNPQEITLTISGMEGLLRVYQARLLPSTEVRNRPSITNKHGKGRIPQGPACLLISY